MIRGRHVGLCQQGVDARMSKQTGRVRGLGLTEGHDGGRRSKSIDAANQKKARGDGVVGRGQPLGGRLMDGIKRPIWFGWGTKMDCGCISVTAVPDDRDEGAEQTE